MGFINEFSLRGAIPKAINASFLTLIPKVKNPQELDEYRPICLIGNMYKIVEKTLAGRFKKVLGSVISEGQNAFLPSRQILEGVGITNELLDFAKRSQKRCMTQ